MKVFYTVLKVMAALAVVAGIIYVVATYGDRIVSWARGLLRNCRKRGYYTPVNVDGPIQADAGDFEG